MCHLGLYIFLAIRRKKGNRLTGRCDAAVMSIALKNTFCVSQNHFVSKMASKAYFNRSAAVEYVSDQWEIVENRPHYVMQEDSSMVLVDPTHPLMPNVEIQQAALVQSTPFEDTHVPAAKNLASVNSDQLDWLWPFDHHSSDAAAHQPQPSTIDSDVKIEATVIDQLDFSSFNLPLVVINNEQKKIDLAVFDAMVAFFGEKLF